MIKEYIKFNKYASFNDILANLDLPSCHRTTINRICLKNGIRTYSALKKTSLSDQNKLFRINFVNYLLNELKPDFQNFIFTDETIIFNKFNGKNLVKTTGNRLDPTLYDNQPKRNFKIIIYGYVAAFGFEIFRINGEFNNEQFKKVLVDSLLLDKMRILSNGTAYFVQDNSPNHELPRGSNETIRKIVRDKGMVYIDFPAYSMDLNVIENFWGILKGNLNEKIKMEKISILNEDHLWNLTNIVLKNIPLQKIKNLVESFKQRLIKVQELGGNLIDK
jgi:transposase